MGLVQGVTRSGLVCDTPSARSADAREARFLVELNIKIAYRHETTKAKSYLWREVMRPHTMAGTAFLALAVTTRALAPVSEVLDDA